MISALEVADAKQGTSSRLLTLSLPGVCAGNFKCERRRLFCGQYIFEDGDEVVVSSPVIQEDYIGTISSVTEDAVRCELHQCLY